MDIDSHYSTLNPIILNTPLNFTMKISSLSREIANINLTARQTIIIYDNIIWTRSDKPNSFAIIMVPSDSAEVLDIIGIYILF